MKYELFSRLYRDCKLYSKPTGKNKELYIHERGYQDWMDGYSPESIINTLESIWSLYWIDMSDIRKGLGLTQYEMSQRYYTSKRTVESWEASGKGKRNITDSQKMLIAYSIFESERDGKNGKTENT